MDFTGGASAAGLSVGTLVINIAVDNSRAQKSLDDLNRKTKEATDQMKAQFNALGGSIGFIGERFGQVGTAINKMFGAEAPVAMRRFGDSIGITADKAKGLKAGMEAAEGGIKLLGQAAQPATLALAGIALGIGSVKLLWDSLGKDTSKSLGGWRGIMQDWLQIWLVSFDESLKVVSSWADSVLGLMAQVATAMMQTPGLKSMGVSLGAGVMAANNMKSEYIDGTRDTISAMRSQNAQGNVIPTILHSMGNDASAAGSNVWDAVKQSGGAFLKMLQETFGSLSGLVTSTKKKGENYFGLYMETIAWGLERQKEREEAALKMREGFLRSSEDLWESIAKQEQRLAESIGEMADFTAKMFADNFAKEKAATQSRWAALGQGQLGTALGAEGLGGSILNQIGGKASQGELTGTVMQGASAGGQAGGPWGALIGAVIALALETKSFSSVMSSIEGILGDVLPILDQAVRPLAIALEGIGKILSPILNIVGWLAEVLMTVARPLDAINDLLAPISDLLNRLIDKIDISGVMDAQVTDSNGNSMSWTDAITGTGLIDAAASEITKAINGGSDRPATEAEVKIANEWLGGNGEYRRMMEQYNAIMAAQAEAKKKETDEANRAAAALKELADSVYNSAPGYKLAAVMYAASDRAGGTGGAGNPYGGG